MPVNSSLSFLLWILHKWHQPHSRVWGGVLREAEHFSCECSLSWWMYFIPVPSHSWSDTELSFISMSLLAFSGDDYKYKFSHVYPGTDIGLGRKRPWLRFLVASDWQGGMDMEWGTRETSFPSCMGILWGEIQWGPLGFYAMKWEGRNGKGRDYMKCEDTWLPDFWQGLIEQWIFAYPEIRIVEWCTLGWKEP